MPDLPREITGSKEDCKYYPCHFPGQDCTWCFCPFYPCLDESKGKFVIGKKGREVWSCKDCLWVHKPKEASRILETLRQASRTAPRTSSRFPRS